MISCRAGSLLLTGTSEPPPPFCSLINGDTSQGDGESDGAKPSPTTIKASPPRGHREEAGVITKGQKSMSPVDLSDFLRYT